MAGCHHEEWTSCERCRLYIEQHRTGIPKKGYNIFAQNDDDDIKAWEGGETPKLGMTITNVESHGSNRAPYKVTPDEGYGG